MDIVIADDHEIFRQSLALLFDSRSSHRVIGHAATFDELLALADREKLDCVLMDYHMPGEHPVQVIEKLRRRQPDTHIIFLTGSQSCPVLKQLSQSQANGVLHKRDNAATILEAVDAVARGERFVSEMVAEMIQQTDAGLTRRELQVLELLLHGHSPAQVGHALGISSRTVEKHKENLMKKLGASNTMELIEAGHRLVMRD